MEKVLEKPRTFLLCERYMVDESTIKLSESEIIKKMCMKMIAMQALFLLAASMSIFAQTNQNNKQKTTI